MPGVFDLPPCILVGIGLVEVHDASSDVHLEI